MKPCRSKNLGEDAAVAQNGNTAMSGAGIESENNILVLNSCHVVEESEDHQTQEKDEAHCCAISIFRMLSGAPRRASIE